MPERLSDAEIDRMEKAGSPLLAWFQLIAQAKEANQLRERCEVQRQLIAYTERLVNLHENGGAMWAVEADQLNAEIRTIKSKLEKMGKP